MTIKSRARHGTSWSSEDDRRLVEALSQGASASCVATELGRSAQAVRKRSYDLRQAGRAPGVRVSEKSARRAKSPRWSVDDRLKLAAMADEGASRREMARALGRTPMAVAGQLQRLRQDGVPVHGEEGADEVWDLVPVRQVVRHGTGEFYGDRSPTYPPIGFVRCREVAMFSLGGRAYECALCDASVEPVETSAFVEAA